MAKNSKCDADVCFGAAGTRCPRVRCEFCSISVHTKCASVSNALHKSLRDSPGLCWLCVKCRDPDSRKTSSNDISGLILQRTTSCLKLVGVLVESMQLFCQMYSRSCSRHNCTVPPQSALAQQVDRSLGEAFQDPLDFTNLFESILGDKRQRTSSITRQSSSPPDKIARVDVPIVSSPMATSTVSIFPDAVRIPGDSQNATNCGALAAAPAATNHAADIDHISIGATPSDSVPHQNSSATSTVIAAAAAAERAAAQAVEQATVRATTLAVEQAAVLAAEQAAMHAAELAAAQAAAHAAELAAAQIARQAAAQASSHASELAAAKIAAHAAEQAAAQAAAEHTATLAVERAAAIAANNAAVHAALPAERRTNQVSNAVYTSNVPVVLAVANAIVEPATSAASENNVRTWYYISKFLPHETSDNIVGYIQGKTNCNPSQIVCHKLTRRSSSNVRPLSFISFKISVPEFLESVVTAENFWPAGVSIAPFLEGRPRTVPAVRPQSTPRSRDPHRDPPRQSTSAFRRELNEHSVQQHLQEAPVAKFPPVMPFLPHYHQFPFYPQYQLAPPQMNRMPM